MPLLRKVREKLVVPRDAFHHENPAICPFHHENPCWEKAPPAQTYVHYNRLNQASAPTTVFSPRTHQYSAKNSRVFSAIPGVFSANSRKILGLIFFLCFSHTKPSLMHLGLLSILKIYKVGGFKVEMAISSGKPLQKAIYHKTPRNASLGTVWEWVRCPVGCAVQIADLVKCVRHMLGSIVISQAATMAGGGTPMSVVRVLRPSKGESSLLLQELFAGYGGITKEWKANGNALEVWSCSRTPIFGEDGDPIMIFPILVFNKGIWKRLRKRMDPTWDGWHAHALRAVTGSFRMVVAVRSTSRRALVKGRWQHLRSWATTCPVLVRNIFRGHVERGRLSGG